MGRRMNGLIWNSELQCGSPCLTWLKTDRLASMIKFELYTGAYGIYWGPANWVVSCVAETEDILPYLTGVYQDIAWVTHGVFTEAYTWKTCTRVRWVLIVSLTTLWTIATRGALLDCVCHIVRFYTLVRLTIDLNLHDYPQIWITLVRCNHFIELSTL
jgi:hypothetical protein